MEQVICLDDRTDILKFGQGGRELTFGKKYTIVRWFEPKDDGRQYISIVNDLGNISEYLLSRFVTNSDYRNFQIDRIFIDAN